MTRAHVFILRYKDEPSNPHLRLAVAASRDDAWHIIHRDELRKFEYTYCGDVDQNSVTTMIGAGELDALNTIAALRFAAQEHQDVLEPKDPAHLERMATRIENDAYDRLMDGSRQFHTYSMGGGITAQL